MLGSVVPTTTSAMDEPLVPRLNTISGQIQIFALGLLLGAFLSEHFDRQVLASSANSGQATNASAQQSVSPTHQYDQTASPTITPVIVSMGAPTLGTNLLLAHQIQSDVLVVNGYDLLKLDAGILDYLSSQSTFTNQASIRAIADHAKSSTLYQIQQPGAQPTAPQIPPGK